MSADGATTSPVVSRSTAEHYSWGVGCDGWHLLRCADLSVIEERMPPGTQEARHLHTYARQFFYILAGIAHIERAEVLHTVGAGQALEIPPGVAHQIFNRGEEDLRFVLISSPPTAGDRQPA